MRTQLPSFDQDGELVQDKGRIWLAPNQDGAPQTIVPVPRFLAPHDRPDAPPPSHRYLGPLTAPAAATPEDLAAAAAAAAAAAEKAAADKATLELFKAWDTNNDGMVSREEFGRAMEAAGLDAPPEEIDALFEHFDPENKGSFDYVDPARPARPEPNPVPDPNSIYGRTPLYYNEGEKCVPVYIYAGGTTLDAYKELKQLVETDPIPAERAAHTPLFRDPRTGGPLSVPQLRDLVRALLYAAGTYDVSNYGAHSLRVGGASALFSIGAERSQTQSGPALRPAGSPQASLSARSCFRLPRGSASLGPSDLRSGQRPCEPLCFLGAEPIAVRALARCDDDVYSLYLRGHAAEARWLALRSVTADFGDALFRHFDQVAHE